MDIMRTYLTEILCKYVLTTPNICDVIFAPHRWNVSWYWTRNTISNVRWFICGSYYIIFFSSPFIYRPNCYIYVHILAIYENIEHINSVDTVWVRRFFLRWEMSSFSVWTQMRSFYFLIVRRDLWSDYFLLKPLSQFAH